MTAPATPIAAKLLRYPEDLAKKHADWVSFEFFTYYGAFKSTPAGVGDKNDFKGFLASYNEMPSYEKAPDMPNIALYMPEDISANYAGKWGGRDFSPLGATALRSVGQGINASKNQGQIEQMVKTLGADLNNMKGGLLPYLASAGIATALNASGFGGNVSTNDVLASTQGVILNPNTEVLYQGPELRTFGLTFKLLPRNSYESNIIRDICNTFKKAQLPRASTRHGGNARNLIGVPNILRVTFMNKNSPSKWVTQFKHCALGGISINYTPDGTWATYTTGAPVAITLGLEFSELKTLYSEEIDDTTNY